MTVFLIRSSGERSQPDLRWLLLEKEPLAKSCASLMLEMKRKKTAWIGAPGFQLLREVELEAIPRKPMRPVSANFKAKALG